MDDFSDSSLGVISNARCLTEGVDIDVIDLVAFMHSKKSKVDIVQAIGRALRLAPGKTHGHILLPLHVNLQTESLEEALAHTDLGDVVDVLRALFENDENLHQLFRSALREHGKQTLEGGSTFVDGESPEDDSFRDLFALAGNEGSQTGSDVPIVIDFNGLQLTPGISFDRIRAALKTRILDDAGESWDVMFWRLQCYKDLTGNCNVPHIYSKDPALGRWVATQRVSHKKKTLSNDKLIRLKGIGFAFTPRAVSVNSVDFDLPFKGLLAFKNEYKHLNVSGLTCDNLILLSRMEYLRELAKKGRLSDDQIQCLIEIGFAFKQPIDLLWEQKFDELKKVGHSNIPVNSGPLWDWVDAQREAHSTGEYPKSYMRRLRTIGFNFQNTWKKHFLNMKRFIKKNGHCNVGWSDDKQLKNGLK